MTRGPDPVDPPLETETGPELANALESHIGYQLRRASAATLSRLAIALSALNLKITEASILVLVDDHPDVTQSVLGRMLGIHRANMAPLAALLTERGLIERSRTEGRSQGLKTTLSGHALAARVRQCMDAQEKELLAGLPERQRAVLIGLLKQIWQP